jgi:hypothetical protein
MGSVDSHYSMPSLRPDTDAYQIDPEKKVRAQLIEPNHWSRSSYTSTVLVDDPTSLLFVADVVDGVTLSSLGQGGSAVQQSNGPNTSEARTARTVTYGMELIAWGGSLAFLSINLH